MIPDFPKEKEKLMKYWNRYLAAKNKELMGFLGKIPTHANHEGHMWDLIQSDGSTHSQPYHEIEGMLTLEISEIPNLTPDKIRQKLDQIAEVIARQMSQKMFEEINRVTSEAGNLVNARGQPFTKELFLQMIEKIDMDFDENGNLKPPALIMNPDLWATKKDEMKSWETDPEFQARYNEIIDRKREEWHDRENCRKLVD